MGRLIEDVAGIIALVVIFVLCLYATAFFTPGIMPMTHEQPYEVNP